MILVSCDFFEVEENSEDILIPKFINEITPSKVAGIDLYAYQGEGENEIMQTLLCPMVECFIPSSTKQQGNVNEPIATISVCGVSVDIYNVKDNDNFVYVEKDNNESPNIYIKIEVTKNKKSFNYLCVVVEANEQTVWVTKGTDIALTHNGNEYQYEGEMSGCQFGLYRTNGLANPPEPEKGHVAYFEGIAYSNSGEVGFKCYTQGQFNENENTSMQLPIDAEKEWNTYLNEANSLTTGLQVSQQEWIQVWYGKSKERYLYGIVTL